MIEGVVVPWPVHDIVSVGIVTKGLCVGCTDGDCVGPFVDIQ